MIKNMTETGTWKEHFNNRYRKMICLKCLLKKPAFDQVLTIFHYNEIIKKINLYSIAVIKK